MYRDIRKLPLFKEIRFNYKSEDGIKYGVLVQFDCEDTLEEYKKVLLGKKAFLMLPKELESYLEIKINDL